MSATNTPRGMRSVIAFVGKRNAGKSSLINAVCGQEISIVSDVAGTTTDAVAKAYELLPLGPVTIYDTAGLDDEGALGQKRIDATKKILFRSDVAVLVCGEDGIGKVEQEIIANLQELKIAFLIAFNKTDISTVKKEDLDFCSNNNIEMIEVCAANHKNIDELKEKIIKIVPDEFKSEPVLARDLFNEDDVVLLVTPIDSSAPKGRLILPQVQLIREVLDASAKALVVKETELKSSLTDLKQKPKLVICDSQVVLKVVDDLPNDIDMTTFSILFARFKGDLPIMVNGARQIDNLKDGDKILIAEACSHHVQEDDIAKVKIPNWLKKYTGKEIIFEYAQGHDFPADLEKYSLVIHCGACMLNRAEMVRRQNECVRRGVPITNYGVAISKAQGVLERAIEVFNL